MRACPDNKDFYRPLAQLWRALAGTWLRQIILKIDDRFSTPVRLESKDWW